MNSFTIVFAVVAVALVGAEMVFKEEDLTLVQDEAYFKEFYSCVMDQAPCSEKMAQYKEAVPTYFETKCGSCTPPEKELFEKLTKAVAEKYPTEFKEMVDKYTPKAE